MKHYLFRLLVFSGSFFLMIGVGELVLRIFDPPDLRQAPFLYQLDPELGRSLRPGVSGFYRKSGTADTVGFIMKVTTDEWGFRVHPGIPLNPRGEVLMIGDSYTFGWGVDDDETIAAYLQKLLAPERIKVVNMGVTAWGTAQYRIRLERYLKNRKYPYPVLGAILIHCRNDILNNIDFYLWKNGFKNVWFPTSRVIPWIQQLERFPNLYLRNWIIWKLVALDSKWQYQEYLRSKKESAGKRTITLEGETISVDELKKLETARAKNMARRILRLETQRILNSLASYQVPWVLMSYVDIGNEDEFFQNLVSVAPATLRCRFVDLREVFPEGYRREDINQHIGGHWSPRANEKIARYFFKVLQKENFLATKFTDD